MVKYKTKEQVLNVATQIIINRWDDGFIDNIIAMKGSLAIHKSQAVYRLLNGKKVLHYAEGFFSQEILLQQPLNIAPSNLVGIYETPLSGRVVSSPVNHTEWWEYMTNPRTARNFFYNQYTGRSFPLSPVYLSDQGKDPETWAIPPVFVSDTPSTVPRWSLDMTNVVGGEFATGAVTELYIEPRATFAPPAIMHAIIKAPAVTALAAGTELLFGFECNGQGGTTIYAVYWEQNAMTLKTRCFTPTTIDSNDVALVQATAGAYSRFWLDYNPPAIRAWEWPFGGSLTLLGTATIGNAPSAYDYVSAFVTNESSTKVSGFRLGPMAIWQRQKA